ncbi:hypothetical protein EEK90_06120 [Muribaculaceae bacterium Isolate-036 (Harlan)]|nr:hypothetical protein EEK90_06120 [Muribaculaceae bacterium Isolate-036 (Harlan)]
MDKETKQNIEKAAWGMLLALSVTALILMCLVATGCTRTIYKPVETVRTEKDVVTRWLTDTVIQNDTRFIFVKGDTVIDWRDRWRERIKEVHDTLYIERTDTVRVPVPVERKLKKWEQTKMDFGGFAIGAIIAVVCIAVIWLIKKFRK